MKEDINCKFADDITELGVEIVKFVGKKLNNASYSDLYIDEIASGLGVLEDVVNGAIGRLLESGYINTFEDNYTPMTINLTKKGWKKAGY